METLTLDKEQIELNFEHFQKTQENRDEAKNDTLFIVLLNKNFDFKGTRTPYEISICGKKMWEWVALAGTGCDIKTTVCTEESDILTLIKPYLNDRYKYTAVFYSDTPLLSHGLFLDIMTYFKSKGCSVLKLTRGYVFLTEYVKNATSIASNFVKEFAGDDFYVVNTPEKVQKVSDILRKRIIDFHVKNGVLFQDRASCYIDADVIIESGTTIAPNNVIYGECYIGKNCTLMPNNVIRDSVVSANCVLKYSYIENSRISENIVVGPFESIINKST